MACLKGLNTFEDDGTKWLYVGDFITFPKKHLKPTDKIKEISKDNLVKFLDNSTNSMKVINGKQAVKFVFALKYIFHHMDNMEACHKLVKEIECCLFKTASTTDKETILSLYQEIGKRNLSSIITSSIDITNELSKIKENEIETLACEYKPRFQKEAWLEICRFETYVSLYNCSQPFDLAYDELLKCKWEIYCHLLKLKEVPVKLPNVSKKVIQNRQKRPLATTELLGVRIQCAQIHKPFVIDAKALKDIQFQYPGKFAEVITANYIAPENKNEIFMCVQVCNDFENNDTGFWQEVTDRIDTKAY